MIQHNYGAMDGPSAVAISAWRALDRSPTREWVAWAVRELVAGRDTPNLRIVAGLSEPFDYFETIRYVDRALEELGVTRVDKPAAIAAYTEELLRLMIAQQQSIPDTLRQLTDLCIECDYPEFLFTFYKLFFAKQDLENGEHQFYWDGADASNIDAIILSEAEHWLAGRAA
jgi:hypothetical protein